MFGSEGVMFQKKRKKADDGDFEGNNYGILFSHGISDNKESSSKREENKEVLSDNYKMFYEIEESDVVLKNFEEIDKEDSKVPAWSGSDDVHEVTNDAKENEGRDKVVTGDRKHQLH
ncbi:hypothetical protein Tco_0671563 [Tanacetum coccineum]